MAANAFVVTARGRFVDQNGNIIPGQVPRSLQMTASDVANAKLTFDDYDAEKAWVVGNGPAEAVAFRFEDYKASEDGEDTSRCELMLGNTATGLILRHDTALDSSVAPAVRMQGLDAVDYPVGTRIGFKQLA